ncbi:hypothetical protein DL763_000876 [Monosporascus cannonballus]|nr:hypothetical protein DL763_000876 [Monosporascus cannonballus]
MGTNRLKQSRNHEPWKNAAGAADSSSARARREHNRQAQHAFRIRKQAKRIEKDRRIQNLEAEVEQIGSAFRDLVDAILQSEYARLDENLLWELRATARQVVILANDEAEGSLNTTDMGGLPSKVQFGRTNGGFSNRVIQATLRYGYTILLGRFGVLILPKIAGTDFKNPVAEDAIKNLSARESHKTLNPSTDPNRRTEIILNANEIEDYIMSRIVGYVDEDVMEQMTGNDSGPGPERQAKSLPSRDFIDCDVFFPVERLQTRKASVSSSSQRQRIIRIFQSRLLENIVYVSVCIAGGLGLRTDVLERAIALSAIDP